MVTQRCPLAKPKSWPGFESAASSWSPSRWLPRLASSQSWGSKPGYRFGRRRRLDANRRRRWWERQRHWTRPLTASADERCRSHPRMRSEGGHLRPPAADSRRDSHGGQTGTLTRPWTFRPLHSAGHSLLVPIMASALLFSHISAFFATRPRSSSSSISASPYPHHKRPPIQPWPPPRPPPARERIGGSSGSLRGRVAGPVLWFVSLDQLLGPESASESRRSPLCFRRFSCRDFAGWSRAEIWAG